jgi:hypothetical protein
VVVAAPVVAGVFLAVVPVLAVPVIHLAHHHLRGILAAQELLRLMLTAPVVEAVLVRLVAVVLDQRVVLVVMGQRQAFPAQALPMQVAAEGEEMMLALRLSADLVAAATGLQT